MYSQETAKSIDEEVRRILDAAHESAKNLILAHKEQVQLMADMLMQFESLDRDDVKLIMDGQWDEEKKKEKEKALENLNRKLPPPAPGSKDSTPKDISKSYNDPLPQQG